jgi:cobalt-zinc-cadmium efflux system protein
MKVFPAGSSPASQSHSSEAHGPQAPGSDGHGSHAHGHHHVSLAATGARRLAMVLAISATLLLVQVVGAAISGSIALWADAGHMLADVGGLALALLAARLARRPATSTLTWGFRRAEVLAAAAQAAVLLAVGVWVLSEAVRRLITPVEVASTAMIVFGAVALAGNAVSALLLRHSASASMNTRAALLEVSNDALGGLAVLIAAVVLTTTGWLRADPVASIVIAVMILPRAWRLLREAVNVLLEATPEGIDLSEVRSHLLSVEHVMGVHDLHANLVATGLPVLSAHLTVEDGCFHDGHLPQLLDEVQDCLVGHFDVHHSTFQFEPAAHAAHEEPCMEDIPDLGTTPERK